MKKVLLPVIAALLLGCESGSRITLYSARPYPPKSVIAERVEGSSPFKVRMYLTPEEPRAEQDVKFEFTVLETGVLVRDAQVHVSLVMPLMDMGKNEFDAAARPPGVYEGSAKFTMGDEWEVIVTVTKGKKKGKHIFNLRVQE
ncbi:MAG TPA: FixH family protein [Terriglobales bacterium]|nr:FixH family protein [Terriglobales bacterium]